MRATDLRHPGSTRTRADRCPGVLRPWPADDGGLARIRVPGGRLTTSALLALSGVAQRYGDARVHVTSRANLQLRGLPLVDGRLPEEVVTAIEATGLLPSRAHDLARNVLVSPLTGLVGGRADLRPVTAALDALLLAEPALGALPGRFLFTLDDGRGDLADRHRDLGLVAIDDRTCQLRVGSAWGQVVDLADAPAALVGLAVLFLDRRGSGPTAAWHVDELPASAQLATSAEPPTSAEPFTSAEPLTSAELVEATAPTPRQARRANSPQPPMSAEPFTSAEPLTSAELVEATVPAPRQARRANSPQPPTSAEPFTSAELVEATVPAPRQARRATGLPLPHGPVPGRPDLTHVAVGEDGIDPATAASWAARTDEVVITPWHGVLV